MNSRRSVLLRFLFVIAAAAVSLLAAACGDDAPALPTDAATPKHTAATATAAPTELPATQEQQSSAPTPKATVAAAPLAEPTAAPLAEPTAAPLAEPTAAPLAEPTAGPIPAAPPGPTPHLGNTEWARQRIDAVISLYRPTKAGVAALHSLDFRQMPGEPGYFGSYGFGGWAGAGEAKPIPVMHELAHSYWGAFPVIGRPNLDWQRQNGEIAPALAAYHRDILAFMSQPPDEFELLRQRMRNLPGLSAENTEPLFHSLEADIPYTTGGDLLLVPPILRKYWGYFLTEGPFGTWEQAAGWLQSLSHEERRVAGKFLGLDHLDLRLYEDIPAYNPPVDFLAAAAEVLSVEERQRLTDFADQFDLLIGDPQLEENFQFWRGYLRDKAALHRAYPEHLNSLALPRTSEISGALDFLAGLEGGAESQAEALREQTSIQPFLVNFLPAVDDSTLVELFVDGPTLPDAPTLQATASFVARLQRFGSLVDRIHAAGRRSLPEGATALAGFLDETGLDREQDLRLFFDLFYGADRGMARRVVSELDGETIQALMAPVPVQLRTILEPEILLRKLDITANAPHEALAAGAAILLDETSGNYRIDEPFLEQLFRVMAVRAETDPAAAASIVANARFPLEGFILSQPAAASLVLSANLETALDLVVSSDPVVSPPARIIYRLIAADPNLAAQLVDGLARRGETGLAAESLAYFAYDKTRSEKFPGLPISLEQDGAFLERLLALNGADWLAARLGEAAGDYRARMEQGEIAPDFLAQYAQTLQAAAAKAPGDSRLLAAVVERALATP